MKKIIVMTLLSATLWGCKKETVVIQQQPSSGSGTTSTVSLKKDTTHLDLVVQPPQSAQILFAGILDVGNADGFVATGAKVLLSRFGDAAMPADYIKNLYFTIEDGTSVVYTSEVKTSIVNNVNSFDQFAKNLLKGKTYGIKVYADVLATATNGTGIADECITSFELIYSDKTGAQNTTGAKSGQKITWTNTPSSTVETYINAATPVTQNVSSGGDVVTLSFDAKSISGASVITEIGIRFDNNLSSIVTQAKLYLGPTLLGSASVLGQTATFSVNTVAPQNLLLSYSVVLTTSTVTSDFSGTSLRTTMDYIKYQSASGSQQTNSTDRQGNDLFLYRSTMTLSYIPLSGIITDSVERDGYSWTESASSAGAMAKKQNTFAVSLIDNGVDDSLKMYPRMFENGVDITSLGVFTNQSGDTIRYLKEGDTKLFFTLITGAGERIIPAGGSKTYALKIRPVGYKHPLDGDGLSIQLLTDQAPLPFDFKYINKGVGGFNAKLSNVASANANAQVQHLVVSDLASSGHSALFQASSNDWKGSYLIGGVSPGAAGLPTKVWTQ